MGIFWRISLAFQELKDGKKTPTFHRFKFSHTSDLLWKIYRWPSICVTLPKILVPHTSPFESSSSVPTYSRMLFGNEYFFSRTLMGLESVYNSLFTDSFFKNDWYATMTTSETRTSNTTGFYETNNNSARASRFFVHFFAVTARLRRENT